MHYGLSHGLGRSLTTCGLACLHCGLTIGSQRGTVNPSVDERRAGQQNAHAFVLHLGAKAIKESVQGMLAGSVTGATYQRRKASHTGDGDDEPLLLSQRRKRCMGAVQGAKKIDIHDPAQHLYLGICKGTAVRDARVVDQNVYATQLAASQGDGIAAGGFQRDIACGCKELPSSQAC